jgi:hypothetical protein
MRKPVDGGISSHGAKFIRADGAKPMTGVAIRGRFSLPLLQNPSALADSARSRALAGRAGLVRSLDGTDTRSLTTRPVRTRARPGGSPSERVSSGGASEGPRPAEVRVPKGWLVGGRVVPVR